MSDEPNGPIKEPDHSERNLYIKTALIWGVPLVLVCGLVLALGIPWIIVGIALIAFGVLLTFS